MNFSLKKSTKFSRRVVTVEIWRKQWKRMVWKSLWKKIMINRRPVQHSTTLSWKYAGKGLNLCKEISIVLQSSHSKPAHPPNPTYPPHPFPSVTVRGEFSSAHGHVTCFNMYVNNYTGSRFSFHNRTFPTDMNVKIRRGTMSRSTAWNEHILWIQIILCETQCSLLPKS